MRFEGKIRDFFQAFLRIQNRRWFVTQLGRTLDVSC
jgi:hypothetical protein